MERIRRGFSTLLIMGAVAWQPFAARGEDSAGPLLCAPTTIVSCQPDGKCERETTESVDLPRFLKVDIANSRISGTRASGQALTAAIGKVDRVEGATILQGVEGDLMWNLMISEGARDMTITAGGDNVGFVAFGACTQE